LADAEPEKTPSQGAIDDDGEGPPVSDALLAALASLASDAFVAVDEQQKISLFSDGAERLFGYTRAEVLGRQVEILIPARHRDAHREHVRRFAATGDATRRMAPGVDLVGLRRDGEELFVETSIGRVECEGRSHLVVALRDVTAQRRAERRARELDQRSQQAIAARNEVLTVVAHDLRNPLHGVLLRVDALVGGAGGSDGPARNSLEAIRVSIGHMDRMIQDLMDIARIESDRLRLARSPERPDAVIDEVMAVYRPIAGRDRVDLRIECDAQLPSIRIDRTRIVRVILNLLTNAGKFGGSDPRVTLSVSRVHEGVCFAVRDHGPGMSLADTERAFDRFWQADESDRRGLGLGLSICKAIVEAHGGHISVESTPGRGSTFSFVIGIDADRADIAH
jgi:PAS domain S-box-containing protein